MQEVKLERQAGAGSCEDFEFKPLEDVKKMSNIV